MKARYRLFRRKSVYYAFDNSTRRFQSLETKDRAEAVRLIASLNEAAKQPAMNLRLARIYLQHSDPAFSSRTWHLGPDLENLLNDLPGQSFLFPTISQMNESDRASLFSRRCRLVGVSRVSLHCYG